MGAIVPRVIAVAEGFLAAAKYQFSEHAFITYVSGFQEITDLKVKELWGLIPVLKLVLLEECGASVDHVCSPIPLRIRGSRLAFALFAKSRRPRGGKLSSV